MIAVTNMNVGVEGVVIEIIAIVEHLPHITKRTMVVLMIDAEAMIDHAHDPTHLVSKRIKPGIWCVVI